MAASYCFRWNEPRYRWYLLSISPEGRFVGDIMRFQKRGGKGTSVKGRLSDPDYQSFLSLAEKLEGAAPGADWDGLPVLGVLGEGPAGRARIIFRYRGVGGRESAAETIFMRIVDLIKPYMQPFYIALI